MRLPTVVLVITTIVCASTFAYVKDTVSRNAPVRTLGTCASRTVGPGRIVCVCNSTYCDKVEFRSLSKPGQVLHYTSSRDGLRLELTTNYYQSKPSMSSLVNATEIEINEDKQFQEIEGFGGGITDATGINVKSLSKAAQYNLIGSYFGVEGIGYSLMRLPMGCNDFSVRQYTYADKVAYDKDLLSFRLAPEDYKFKIPFIREAKLMCKRRIKVLAAPWTAPEWMKGNNGTEGTSFLLPKFYQTWANYYAKFIAAYRLHDIHIGAVSTQNEPANGNIFVFPIPRMGWTPEQQRLWVSKYLSPALKRNGARVKIIGFDDQRLFLPGWVATIFEDKEALEHTDFIGVHWYTDTLVSTAALEQTRQMFPMKKILYTEACIDASSRDNPSEPVVDLGSWKRGEKYISSIMETLRAGVVGWIDANMALDMKGGPNFVNNFADSPIIVDKSCDEFYKQPMYYALGHFSTFVVPGSRRIQVKVYPLNSCDAVGFITPHKKIVVVVANYGKKVRMVTIKDKKLGKLPLALQPRSIHTLVYKYD